MEGFIEGLKTVNGAINNVVWGVPALTLLIGTGILMTILTRFFQFGKIKLWWRETIGKLFKKKSVRQNTDKNSISQFQALCTALSATIGTGNITGVALAIATAGPGAVFWMWIAAIVGMMTNYSENVLGIYYRRRNPKGEWSGGAMYYLKDGLGGKKNLKTVGKVLAILFSIFAVVASFGIGNMGQISSIRASVTTAIQNVTGASINGVWIGVILMVVAGLVVIGGLQRIAKINERIVPFMAGFYILGSLIIICMNIGNLGPAFGSIFAGAFSFKAAAGGVGGYVISQAITWGFKRGVFSNEAGLGSSVMVHSTSNVKEPVVQGMWGIFEVFMDTIIVCTMTALVILTSGVVNLETGAAVVEGVDSLGLATAAFTSNFGSFGGIFVAVAVTLFAFSTVLGWSFYGTKSWEFLFGTKSTMIYKVIFILAILASSVMDTSLAVDLSDTFNGLMSLPNLIGVIFLSGTVVKITKNYLNRKVKGSNEKPMLSAFDEIQAEAEASLDNED